MTRQPCCLSCADFAMFRSFLASLTRHIPPGQLGRYLVVGVWNTVFGYGTFALFTALLGLHPCELHGRESVVQRAQHHRIVSRLQVVRLQDEGYYAWARCLMVYSGSILIGLAVLPPTVFAVSYVTGNPRAASVYRGRADHGRAGHSELHRAQDAFVQACPPSRTRRASR